MKSGTNCSTSREYILVILILMLLLFCSCALHRYVGTALVAACLQGCCCCNSLAAQPAYYGAFAMLLINPHAQTEIRFLVLS